MKKFEKQKTSSSTNEQWRRPCTYEKMKEHFPLLAMLGLKKTERSEELSVERDAPRVKRGVWLQRDFRRK